jgi:cytochrome c553
MRGWLGLAGVMAVAFVAGSPGIVAADDGKTVYGKKCATCHGEKGEGKPAIAKMMKVELRHLGSTEIQAKTDAELAKVITEGIAKMKPVKGLSESDVTAVVAHVRTLKP